MRDAWTDRRSDQSSHKADPDEFFNKRISMTNFKQQTCIIRLPESHVRDVFGGAIPIENADNRL
jgi:hypothetical protein